MGLKTPEFDIENEVGEAPLVSISNKDKTREVDIINVSGVNRMATDTAISSVNVPLGKDPIPDCFFIVSSAGQIGDQVRIEIAGTSVDPTSPDRDLVAVDFTYTLVLEDVGDEVKLAENIFMGLETDANFQNALLEAQKVFGDNRAIVHISSMEFSLSGEFHERPVFGDVTITVTSPGVDTIISIDDSNRKIVSRAKEVSLDRDPRNPHRLGVQRISGTVFIRAQQIDQILEDFASNGAVINLAVNPAGPPDIYSIDANPIGGKNKVIEALKLFGSDGNIKTGKNNFMGLNSPLANGILIQIRKNGVTSEFKTLKTTTDFQARMSSSPEKSNLFQTSGVDYLISVFDFIDKNFQLTLEAGTDDAIIVTIQDALAQIDELFLSGEGFLEDA